MTDMRTPTRKVRGLGATRTGTSHFWHSRVTGVALVPLALFAIGLVLALTGEGYDSARAVVGQPLVATGLALFVVVAVDHMRLGMQEIIADYAHDEMIKVVLLILNTFFTVAVGAAAIFALLKLAFGG